MKYLGFVLLVLSGYVMAEEVYYCSDNPKGGRGFYKNEQTGQYEHTLFKEKKFKMKLQDDGNIVTIEDDGYKNLYLCSILGGDTELKSCVHQYTDGSLFNFNQDNGRYIWFRGFGYVFSGRDSVSLQIGTCTKF